jgi:NDP-sugar pyrophosphorylase family protein
MPPAIVLAAGLGTRMRPATLETPKALMPAAGKPLIAHTLAWLKGQGVTEAVVNTHHLGRQVLAALGNGAGVGLRLRYSHEPEILGTGGGVARACELIGRERVLVTNADTLIDADLAEVIARHEAARAIATMVLIKAPDPENYKEILMTPEGNIVAIGGEPTGKGRAKNGLTPLTFTGLSILEPELIDYLHPDRFGTLPADGLIPSIADGKIIAAYVHTGYWKAIDTLAKLREAEQDIARGKFPP